MLTYTYHCPTCWREYDRDDVRWRDEGIGEYEYWGCRGRHRDLAAFCPECDEYLQDGSLPDCKECGEPLTQSEYGGNGCCLGCNVAEAEGYADDTAAGVPESAVLLRYIGYLNGAIDAHRKQILTTLREKGVEPVFGWPAYAVSLGILRTPPPSGAEPSRLDSHVRCLCHDLRIHRRALAAAQQAVVGPQGPNTKSDEPPPSSHAFH
jgi:hypothetical protein